MNDFDNELHRLLEDQQHLATLSRDLICSLEDAEDATAHAAFAAHCKAPDHPGAFIKKAIRNKLINLRRNQQLRTRHERLAAREEAQVSTAEFVAREEARHRIGQAVIRLAEPYRTAIWLRYFEGLETRQVADQMQSPVATARIRLQRGLALLRVTLDQEFGGRERWLAVVTPLVNSVELPPPSPLPSTGGVTQATPHLLLSIALKKAAILIASALLLAWWSLTSTRLDPVKQVQTTGTPNLRASAVIDASNQEEALRSSLPDQHRSEAQANTIRGRVIAAESGTPLAGASVEFRWRNHSGEQLHKESKTTHSDGSFDWKTVLGSDNQVYLSVSFPGRVPLIASSWELNPGVGLELGDMALAIAVTTVVRIEDDHGAAIAGYQLQLDPAERKALRFGLHRQYGQYGGGILTSDAEGRLPTYKLYAGAWQVQEMIDPRYRFIGPSRFEVEPTASSKELIIRVERAKPKESISGRLLDQRGNPVVGVEVQVRDHDPLGYNSTETHADGSFVFARMRSEQYKLSLSTNNRQWTLVNANALAAILPGTNELEVVVTETRTMPVVLNIKQKDLSTPIKRYAFATVPIREDPNRFGTRMLGSPKVGIEVDGTQPHHLSLLPGHYLLFADVRDSGVCDILARRFVVEDFGTTTLNVAVPETTAVQVRVVDSAGQPVVGSDVQLLLRCGSGELRTGYLHSVDAMLLRGSSGTHPVIALSSAITDSEGMTTINLPSGIENGGLYVTGNSHRSVLYKSLANAALAPITIEVQRSATISGHAHPLEDLQDYGPSTEIKEYTRLFRDGQDRLDRALPRLLVVPQVGGKAVAQVRIQLDGSFSIPHVPPGDWELVLRDAPTHRLAQVAGLRRGETRVVELDVSTIRRFTVEGSALLDGKPASQFVLRFEGEDHPEQTLTRADGSFLISTRHCRVRPILEVPRPSGPGPSISLPAVDQVELMPNPPWS